MAHRAEGARADRPPATAAQAARPAGRFARWFGGLGDRAMSPLAALIIVVLIALPLLSLLAQAFLPNLFNVPASLVPSLAGMQSVLQSPYALRAGVDSLVLAFVTALLATAIGLAVAYLVVLTDLPHRGFVWAVVWLIFIAPSFLLAQGWELLLQPGGLATGFLGGVPTRLLLSPWGVGFVLTLKLFPFATLAVAPALEGLGQDAVHASRLSGASWATTWRRILLPLLTPALLAGGLIVFAEVLSDFGVASTLAQSANFPLITYNIYTALEQFPINFSGAAFASLLLVASVGLAQFGQRAVTGRRVFATRTGGSRVLAQIPLGRWRRPAFAAFVLFGVVAFAVPAAVTGLASFVPGNAGGLDLTGFTFANYTQAIHVAYGLDSFLRSLAYATLAATIGVALGLAITLAWRRSGGPLVTVLQALLTTTIAVPGIVLGAGYIFFWDQPFLSHVGLLIYGTPVALLFGYLAGGLPYSVRVATGAMSQIPDSVVLAARSSGAGLGALVRRIIVPMLGDTWIRIWLMLFAGVMFELPVSQLLYPAGGPTLAVAIVHQFHSSLLGLGAALTTISTTAVALVAGLVLLTRRLLVPVPRVAGAAVSSHAGGAGQ